MKVGILSMKGNFDNRLGQGTQRYIYELWKNMREMRNDDVHVDKLEFGFGKSNLAHKVSFTLSLPFKYLGEYDIIHVLNGIPFAPPLRKSRAKIVTTINELVVLDKGNPFRKALERSAPTLKDKISDVVAGMIRKQQLSSDYIIAISDKTLKEAVKLGYSKDRIFVVNLGIDERFLAPLKKRKKNRKFKVGFLGGFNVRKNAIFAVNAFKMINDRDIVFELWGRKSGEYQNIEKAAGSDERIKFMGFAPEERLLDIYESFDAFVYPTLYGGLELELLEAQARGVPVIMYKPGKVTKEAKYYLAAEDEKDMARIIKDLKDNGFDDSTRKKAMAYARSFTWKKTTDRTLEVYRKIAKMG